MIELNEQIRGDVSVAYSGGLDSTAVACLALEAGAPRVHLHTLEHGYGYLFNRWAARTARSAARAMGEHRVVHRFVSTRDLFTELSVRPLLADRRAYGQWFGCCLGCVMSLATEMIIYNLEHGIPHVMAGSSVGGEYSALSMPATVAGQRGLCARYGMRYHAPLIEQGIVKADERAFLRARGVRTGLRFLDKHSFGNQGYCLPSLQHLPDVLLNVHPTYDPDAVARAHADKAQRCHAYIEARFRGREPSLAARVERLRRLSGVTE